MSKNVPQNNKTSPKPHALTQPTLRVLTKDILPSLNTETSVAHKLCLYKINLIPFSHQQCVSCPTISSGICKAQNLQERSKNRTHFLNEYLRACLEVRETRETFPKSFNREA